MSTTIHRLILIQGTLQLLNALATIKEYGTTNEPNTIFKDTLLLGGMLAGEATQELTKTIHTLAKAYSWESIIDIAPHENSLYRIHDHSPERSRSILRRIVDNKEFDIVVSSRNWQAFNEVCLAAYPEAKHICIGDGLGLVDFVNSPSHIKYHEIRQILPIFCNAHHNVKNPFGDILQTIVPKDNIVSAITRIHKKLPLNKEIDSLPDPSDTVLILGSTWSESGFMSVDSELELDVHLAGIGQHIILYKPHPRAHPSKTEKFINLLRNYDFKKIHILDGILSRIPVELFLQYYTPLRAMTSYSGSIRNLLFLYPQFKIQYLQNDAWNNFLFPNFREYIKKIMLHEQQILRNIISWDRRSVLMQYLENIPGRPTGVPDVQTNHNPEKPYLQEDTSSQQPKPPTSLQQQKSAPVSLLHQLTYTKNTLLKHFPQVKFGLNVQVIGIDNTHIGNGSCISDNSWLNVCFRDDKIRLNIGKRVLIGRGSMLSAGGLLELGDYCLLAPQVYISDADHVYTNITRPYMDQGATSGHIVIEENCWLGIHAVIAGTLTVGRGSVVAANAVVTKDVPPFAVVGGVPAHILKLFNFKTAEWETVRDDSHLSDLLSQRESFPPPPRAAYAAMLRKNSATTFIEPILAGRGQCL